MHSRERARVKSMDDDDRISGLCDELLHRIFSFLPTRDVVQTCVLSKRWRNLWCSVPWLDFDEEEFIASSSSSSSSSSELSHHAGSFSKLVCCAMLCRDDSTNVEKLRLCCCYDDDVFLYLVAALEHNLKVVDLKILQHHHNQANKINVLPSSLFTCESLTCLTLNNVVLPSYSSIHLPWLKTMHLISVKFPSKQYTTSQESLFSNSPILETLTIHNCNFKLPQKIKISALQLKHLIIIQDVAPSPPSSIPSLTKISAPNLISLKLHVDLQSEWYLFYDLNSLVEANIHITQPNCHWWKPFSEHISLSFMIGIFGALQNAKAITLSGSCLEVIGKVLKSSVETIISKFQYLGFRFMKSKETPFHNLKLMKLKTWYENGEVHAITDLLKRSPNIETLVIDYNSESSYELENELPLREEKMPSECTLHHLKTIQMRGFGERKNKVKLLTFLLENAKSLKKMIVEEAST